MSKALRIVATVASIAAIIPGPHQPIAMAVATVASIGATLTQKKPPALGNTSQIMIGANLPMPYTIGRTYVGGALLHDVGYGGTIDDVPNPYRSMVLEWSGAGPVDEIEAFQADFATVNFSGGEATGYYDNFMWLDTQLGATPEASALAGPHGAIPQWGASYKLSGHAAGLVTLKFDKKGKRYASGVPQFGAILKGVLVYDPRLDSSYPGGSGSHDFDDETTWEYSDNPALHALAYARGRYQNGKKVIGCGFPRDSINIAAFVELANICDTNVWTVGGTIYEPGSRWDNLKRILEVASASPMFVGAMLSVRFSAPKVALDTITAADLADGQYVVPAMKTWRDRKNGLIPKYRSEAHKWEMVQSDLVSVPEYVTEDGEEKEEEFALGLCQDKDQAAQLAAYALVNGREFGPIVLPCKPRLIEYLPGEALEVDIPELGLNSQLCVITGRKIDPGTASVELTLESETTAKHAFALGQTGTAPPTPTITTGEDMDDILSTTSPPQIYEVADEAEQLALNAGLGDVAIRTDLSTTFIHNGGDTGTMADWTEALSPPGQPPDGTLDALALYDTNGLLTQTATDTFTGRTITGTASEITVTNGSGVAGNPTISLPSAITGTGKTWTGGTFASLSSASIVNSQDAQTNLRVDNANSGTGALAVVDFRNGALASADRMIVGVLGTGYTLVTGWQDAGVVSTQNNITGGLVLNSVNSAGIKFEVGGNGSTNQRAVLTTTAFNLTAGVAYQINGTQVVTARQTGWGAATGTATRTAIATYTAPTITNPPTQAEVQAIADALQAWSRRGKAVTDDLATHGLIGA